MAKGVKTPEKTEEQKTLKAALPLSVTQTNSVISAGQVEVCRIDADGNEVINSEFVVSARNWDKIYSKDKQYKLKKN